MHRLILLVPVFILASSCRPVTADSDACQASLDGLNRTGVEQVVFARHVSGTTATSGSSNDNLTQFDYHRRLMH